MSHDSGAAGSGSSVKAHAKLNIALRVLAREESGFHSIETLLLRLELADRLEIEETVDERIDVEVLGDPEVPVDSSNLCVRAAAAIRRRVGHRNGVRIRLEKRIPAGAGLGGGSSDAATVLRCLNDRWGLPLDDGELVRLGGELGSDIPFFLCGSPMALAWEHGRRLLPLTAPPSRPVLVLVPGYPIGAGDAYRWLAEARDAGSVSAPGPALLPPPAAFSEWTSLKSIARNDLEEAVFDRHPDLARLRDALLEGGAEIAALCGSGSCVAGVFRDASGLEFAAGPFEKEEGLSLIRTRTQEDHQQPG